jgi:hypothetical protein
MGRSSSSERDAHPMFRQAQHEDFYFYFKRMGLILSLSKDERQDTLGALARAQQTTLAPRRQIAGLPIRLVVLEIEHVAAADEMAGGGEGDVRGADKHVSQSPRFIGPCCRFWISTGHIATRGRQSEVKNISSIFSTTCSAVDVLRRSAKDTEWMDDVTYISH